MRAFNTAQISVFLNAFGEELTLTSTVSFLAIFEQSTYGIETDAGVIQAQEEYFTAPTGSADYTDTFTRNGQLQEIYNIEDDLSGLSNYYYRNHE